MTVTQPYERIPMWHRVGGMMVTTGPQDNQTLRIDNQDWSELTIEAFVPEGFDNMSKILNLKNDKETEEVLVEKLIVPQDQDGSRTSVTVTMARRGNKIIMHSNEATSSRRTYHVRFHLRKGQRVVGGVADGKSISVGRGLTLYEPLPEGAKVRPKGCVLPFLGQGTRQHPELALSRRSSCAQRWPLRLPE